MGSIWFLASLWQLWNWINVSASAVTCAEPRVPIYALSTPLTTIVIIIVSALFHLAISPHAAGRDRAGGAIAMIGMGLSAVVGSFPVFILIVLIAGTLGHGDVPVTVPRILDEVFVLGFFAVPPIAGIVAIAIQWSGQTRRGPDAKRNGVSPFAISAGVLLLWLIATYFAVATNCGGFL